MSSALVRADVVAHVLGIKESTVRTRIRRGQLRAVACDVRTRRSLFDVGDVLADRRS